MKKIRVSDIVLLIIILMATLALPACQPTPEEQPVVGKGDNHLEEMIASSAVSPSPGSKASEGQALMKAAGAPEALKDSYTNNKGDVTVNIDAKVEVPLVEALPVVRVSMCGFSQEQVDRFAEYFLRGAPAYMEEQVVTREEIQEEIIRYEQTLETIKGENGAGNSGAEEIKNRIEELKKQYPDAPEQRKTMSATFELDEIKDGTCLMAKADLGKDEEAEFSVSKNGNGGNFFFRNDGKGSYEASPLEPEAGGEAVRGMETTREEAENIATQCLSDLGIEDMQIESVKAATFYNDWDKMGDKGYEASAKQCYVFDFTRTVGGVPVTNIQGSVQTSTDDPNVTEPPQPDFSLVCDPETLEVYVDDTGVVRFEWYNPSNTEEVLSEHVELFPFADVIKRARDNIFFKNYTAYGSKAVIYITSIKLGMMRIARKDRLGEYLIIPVWDLIGNQNEGLAGHEEWLPFGDQSFVTINAIDGSSINRDWGY